MHAKPCTVAMSTVDVWLPSWLTDLVFEYTQAVAKSWKEVEMERCYRGRQIEGVGWWLGSGPDTIQPAGV